MALRALLEDLRIFLGSFYCLGPVVEFKGGDPQ